jgi:hypothetical protein
MKKVVVNDKMQKNYSYILSEPMGKNFDIEFKPQLSPKEMLELGIFGGVYMRDCKNEFPADWFEQAKFSTREDNKHIAKLNYFGADTQTYIERRAGGYWYIEVSGCFTDDICNNGEK